MATTFKQERGGSIDPLRLYTYEEAAGFLAVELRQIKRMVVEGRLGYVKTGPVRGRRVSGQNIIDYIAANTVSAES